MNLKAHIAAADVCIAQQSRIYKSGRAWLIKSAKYFTKMIFPKIFCWYAIKTPCLPQKALNKAFAISSSGTAFMTI